jgi:segregation and condensation protein B
MDQNFITRIVEAALLAANQPLTLAQLHSLFPEEQPAPNDSVETALETLRDACEERGVELVELASGFRYQVKADVHAWVSRLWTDRKTKYTRATLETLALIAYRQPITRGEIEQVRGVAVSSNIIQALEEREWIRVVGHRDVPGKPALFGTTRAFLDYFGLKRLDELPPLSELKDIGELEPQLQFDNVMTTRRRSKPAASGTNPALKPMPPTPTTSRRRPRCRRARRRHIEGLGERRRPRRTRQRWRSRSRAGNARGGRERIPGRRILPGQRRRDDDRSDDR